MARTRLDSALASVADRGTRGVHRSHDRVAGAIDPLAVELEVLRLRLHTATAGSDAVEADAMAAAAALCDDARGQLDELRRLIAQVGGAAGIAQTGPPAGPGSAG